MLKKITEIPFVLTALSSIVWLITVLWLGIRFKDIPNRVVIHYNFLGVADRWGPKISLMIILAIGLVIYCFITYIHYISRKRSMNDTASRTRNQELILRYAAIMVGVLKFLLSIFFFYLIIMSARNKNLFFLTSAIFLIGIFLTILFFVVKSVRIEKLRR